LWEFVFSFFLERKWNRLDRNGYDPTYKESSLHPLTKTRDTRKGEWSIHSPNLDPVEAGPPQAVMEREI